MSKLRKRPVFHGDSYLSKFGIFNKFRVIVSYFYVAQCTLLPRLPGEASHWWQVNVWWTMKMYFTIRGGKRIVPARMREVES